MIWSGTSLPPFWKKPAKIASEVLAPLNAVGDTEGCVMENGVVRTPSGFKEAFGQMSDGGWPGMDMPENFGGMGLPYVMTCGGRRDVLGRQHGVHHVPGPDPRRGLRHPGSRYRGAESDLSAQDGVVRMDRHHEPDRAALRHRSGPDAHESRTAGRWQLTRSRGQKIFHLGSGEHDMADNIVHLVLAQDRRAARKASKVFRCSSCPKFNW